MANDLACFGKGLVVEPHNHVSKVSIYPHSKHLFGLLGSIMRALSCLVRLRWSLTVHLWCNSFIEVWVVFTAYLDPLVRERVDRRN